MKHFITIICLCFLWSPFSIAQNSITDFFEARQAYFSDISLEVNVENEDFMLYRHNPPIAQMMGAIFSSEEMKYYNIGTGKDFVAIVTTIQYQTPEGESFTEVLLPDFYELENGALVDKTMQYFPNKYEIQTLIQEECQAMTPAGRVFTSLGSNDGSIEVAAVSSDGMSDYKQVGFLKFDEETETFVLQTP